MSVAVRTITDLKYLDDVNVTVGAGVDGYALCWDNDTAKFLLRAIVATGSLLATGATVGATAQAQVFTNGVISNGRLGIGTTPATTYPLDILTTGGNQGHIRSSFANNAARPVWLFEGYSNSGARQAGFATAIGLANTDSTETDVIYLQHEYLTTTTSQLSAYLNSAGNSLFVAKYLGFGIGMPAGVSPAAPLHVRQTTGGAVDVVAIFEFDKTIAPVDGESAYNQYQLDTSTTASVPVADTTWSWDASTHASRKGAFEIAPYDTVRRVALRVAATGSAAAIGFLGAPPAARIAHVADPAGGGTVDAEARTAINSILATLETFGFHATS